jgi:hypothetical protein
MLITLAGSLTVGMASDTQLLRAFAGSQETVHTEGTGDASPGAGFSDAVFMGSYIPRSLAELEDPELEMRRYWQALVLPIPCVCILYVVTLLCPL